MEKMNVLVTGSSGTIGTALCKALMKDGHNVMGIDIKPNEWSPEVDAITVKSDIREGGSFEGLPSKPDAIIHLAANALVYPLVVEPIRAIDNLKMAFNTLEYARNSNIKKFIFGSSREVYGNSEKSEHKEDDVRIEGSESPYAATKLAAEALVRSYQQCYGIDYITIRFSNVYGMYDNSDRLIPLSIKRALKGDDLIVFGKEKMLDFTYIDDAINGIIASLKYFDSAKNQTYNIATGNGTKIMDVVEMINDSIGRKSKIVIKESRVGEVVKYIANISKAKANLGYSPNVEVEEGIDKSVDWYNRFIKL